MSAPEIPNPWTLNTTSSLSGGLDLDLDNIHIRAAAIERHLYAAVVDRNGNCFRIAALQQIGGLTQR